MVGSPNHLHLPHIKEGLQAGLTIFAEKPIVINEDQTYELAKLIKEYVLRLLKIAFKRTRSTYAYRNDKLPPRRFCAKCDNYYYYITCDSI